MPVAYCWRDTGCYGTTHAERDCYRTAYARTSERLRRLVEAAKAAQSAEAAWWSHRAGCDHCTAFASDDDDLCDEGVRVVFAARDANEALDALLADGDA